MTLRLRPGLPPAPALAYHTLPMCRTSLLLISLFLAACASDARNDSARAWQIAECNRVIDKEDRVRCVRRAEDDYGRRSGEAEAAARKK